MGEYLIYLIITIRNGLIRASITSTTKEGLPLENAAEDKIQGQGGRLEVGQRQYELERLEHLLQIQVRSPISCERPIEGSEEQEEQGST